MLMRLERLKWVVNFVDGVFDCRCRGERRGRLRTKLIEWVVICTGVNGRFYFGAQFY